MSDKSNKMENKGSRSIKTTIILVAAIVNFAISIFLVIYITLPKKDASNNTSLPFESIDGGQYTIYIGLNDKDTHQQIIPTAEAIAIVNNICFKYVDGYTVSEAMGSWTDSELAPEQETTLIYSFVGANEASVISIMDEVLTSLNQRAILIQYQDVTGLFYYGSE